MVVFGEGSAMALALAAAFFFSLASAAPDSFFGCYDSIVSFGDSLTDTGNDLVPGLHRGPCPPANPPYGRTYFHHPTGRFSDGRLIIDFIAQSLGLPLLKPYFSKPHNDTAQRRRSFSTGVNFAVSGASVLPYEFYKKMGCLDMSTNVSLGTQMEWFRTFLAGLPDGRKYLERCLFVLGPIGGNDYNNHLQLGKTLDELQFVTPLLELIKLGVMTILAPGNLPDGCMPISLTSYGNSSTHNDYDPQIGCLSGLNEFSGYHNDLLQKELQRIRELHPHVNIMYGDYYNNAMRMYLAPNQFGFRNQILRSCCGGGGTYNYNPVEQCGSPQATCCRDPAEYISWDGIHFTEAANRVMAKGLLQGPYTDPPFSTNCIINSTSTSTIAEY
ncbi:GDSL esterase/lipase At1g28580-like isoform X2 [Andrographis paniculata]|uniref:GDSL esterase/lipase At1g28580-like isoform X2 n=1 Tax=Andrographis paniculata TaxID=175694 RepID=UPI0021E76766|nr:GDSL esterase/lipase At1g28580-like isoform X2 [Andrographis paniculata]